MRADGTREIEKGAFGFEFAGDDSYSERKKKKLTLKLAAELESLVRHRSQYRHADPS